MSHHYTFDELVAAMRQIGVQAGDVIFTHVDLAALGMPELANANLPSRNRRALGEAICRLIYNAVTHVIGDGGTWLVPTYSYSFGKQAIFDPAHTPSEVGVFTEWFRQQSGVIRSDDPMFSVAGIGPQTAALFADLPHDCFGRDCVYDRLRRIGAKVVNLGVGVRDMTFLHHVEQSVGVPYRFKKLFLGQQMLNDGDKPHLHKSGWLYNVRPFTENCRPAFGKLDPVLRQHGQLRSANLGMGEVLSVACDDLFTCAAAEIRRDPWFLAQGPALSHAELLAKEEARALGSKAERNAEIGCLKDTRFLNTQNLIDTLWRYPRDIISAGYDTALNLIVSQFDQTDAPQSKIHEFPSGTEAFTWVVPEAWHCQEAYLETLDGRRLFSYADHPLHVVSYSLPFEGVVSRAELFSHLHTHPLLPHATPFKFKYYERDWGLCCSADLKRSLTHDAYRVVIRSTFTYGTLKVAEIVAQGRSPHSFVLCAHLCHPHQVNDDLAGVVVGINVMRELLKRASQPNGLNYTYRLLILPETIGSVAWLKNLELKIENLKLNAQFTPLNPQPSTLNAQPATLFGGLFLEMLGTDLPHSLQLSLQGDTPLDKLMRAAVQQHDANSWVGAFNTVIGNDERQFNAPGIRVPMLSLSRVHRPDHPHYPYLQYHSTDDTPDIINDAPVSYTHL
ncbi:MAG: DUF4910 domain-containing protein, partial [Anaerolineae bacterium]|nr:DUF4910 domain-containing protein [Anaerolineae bacterium]